MDRARLTIALQFGGLTVECISPNRAQRDAAKGLLEKFDGVAEMEEDDAKAFLAGVEKSVTDLVVAIKRGDEVIHEGDEAREWFYEQGLLSDMNDLLTAFRGVLFRRWLSDEGERQE